MATTTKKVLRMSFTTSLGGASITLPDPVEGLTAAQIEAVMDEIISKNIFVGSTGEWIAKKDIKLIHTSTEDLFNQA